jgi:hypothetical protein
VVLEADCTFFSIDMVHSPPLASLFWQIEAALVFSPWIRQQADAVVSRLRAISLARGVADGRFNALHVRVETDWVEHCRKWEVPGERDNCMTHTHQLDRVLAIEGVDQAPPLFVAGELTSQTMASLPGLSTLVSNATGYQLLSKDMLTSSIFDGRTFQASQLQHARKKTRWFHRQRHLALLGSPWDAVCRTSRAPARSHPGAP